ncbi:MAG TPA: hypothetical protein VM145_07250 [Sphingomicrobium sp.]|nr:hypothetical protein [Sphingomicrobium sp.]
MSDSENRRRWVTLGEIIALLALVVSAAGLWLTWKSNNQDKTTKVVEQKQPIPLALRGRAQNDGRQIVIEPVEDGHALESLTVAIKGASPIEVGSDGELSASDVESALKGRDEDKGAHSLPVRITARYVEMGKDRTGGGSYVLRYRWEGGGLFGGRSLKLTGLSR